MKLTKYCQKSIRISKDIFESIEQYANRYTRLHIIKHNINFSEFYLDVPPCRTEKSDFYLVIPGANHVRISNELLESDDLCLTRSTERSHRYVLTPYNPSIEYVELEIIPR